MKAALLLTGLVVFFTLLTGSHGKAIRDGCTINVGEDLSDPQPLLLIPGGSKDGLGFYLPEDNSGDININAGADILLACPGDTNYLTIGDSTLSALAKCKSGTSFTVDSEKYDFSEFTCKKYPVDIARRSGQNCYDGTKTHIEVGFEVGSDFYTLMDICFDETLLTTLYSKFILVSGIGGYQSGFPRPNFIQDDLFEDLPVNYLYTKSTQRETIGHLLGSAELADKYIADTGDYFIARGHLAAKADFVYGSVQRSTFHFVNVLPQWQTFNGKNWNALEMSVRKFADENKLTLDVYTGSYGIATLPAIDDYETKLYLYVDENNNKALPVPKLYWKVAYDPQSQAGIAFIGVNNPYVTDLSEDYLICDDVCSKVSWLQWDQTNIDKGYSYCCEVNEFRSVVDTLPEFTVTSLLT